MTKKVGSTGRYGSRYGKKLKSKILAVEKIQRKKQKCPYCHRTQVKRISAGIWHCKKCNAKFTGRAYRI
ncbi:MAG: 50S ribosomal protein L37ae [Nanoarchaeota archaeon]|nr:50S ribosomal protein L37ae [Nanoarchaeota archaeon]